MGQMSHLDGASVEPYLLEKSRVLNQGEGERNFHILYELVAGAIQDGGLAKELKVLILKTLGGFRFYRIARPDYSPAQIVIVLPTYGKYVLL